MRAVDLFAGWGGFSLGAEQAGVDVVWAANHWPLAVRAHQLNHPTVQHKCQDIRQAGWSSLPQFDLLLASPACQGHSQASQPKRRKYHDSLRATAWAVIDCADATEPQAIIVENVPDFKRWRLYPAWRYALRCLGYKITETVLRASKMGVPQRRDRLFVVASKTRIEGLDDLQTPHETAFGPYIDWDSGRWRPISKARAGAQGRIQLAKYNHGPRCITQHVTGHQGLGLDVPIRTITTQDQWALVDGDQYRPLTIRETARAMGFPDNYSWPAEARRRDTIRGLGNAVCPPVATQLITAVQEQL